MYVCNPCGWIHGYPMYDAFFVHVLFASAELQIPVLVWFHVVAIEQTSHSLGNRNRLTVEFRCLPLWQLPQTDSARQQALNTWLVSEGRPRTIQVLNIYLQVPRPSNT